MRASTRSARSTISAIRLPALAFGLLLGALAAPAEGAAQQGHDHGAHVGKEAPVKVRSHHPEPRPGVTAAGVLRARDVPSRAREGYTVAARIPEVLDGLFCHCECHERDGLRSLLECFKSQMGATCGICQNQAVLAGELHAKGRSLAKIRAAMDQRWGG